MAFNPENYLDIWNIVTYEIVGATSLVMIIGVLLIAFFSAKNAIPFQSGITFIIMWLAIVSILTSDKGLYAIVVLVVGIFFYWVLSRIFRRG